MKKIFFDYTGVPDITKDAIVNFDSGIHQEIEKIRNARSKRYETEYASINLPFDIDAIRKIKHIVEEKQELQPTVLVIIGIGGSNLGTMAIYQALYGSLHNELHNFKVYFVDTVDPDYNACVMRIVEQKLIEGNNVLLNVISKSGTTTETIVNFQLFLHVLRTHRPYNYYKYIVITTDEGSQLWKYAHEHDIVCIPISEKIGGRYSVFSGVGLFPLCLMGVDIDALCEGACDSVMDCTLTDILSNAAAVNAILLAIMYKKGFVIHNMFVFSPLLESYGLWYRQLLGESIGKKYDRDKNVVNVGIIPVVSVGTTDLHSVGQLYLGGPYNVFTTFISVIAHQTKLPISTTEDVVKGISVESCATLMESILVGVKSAYYADKRPFVSLVIPEKSEYYIGQLLQMKMVETMYLGYLLRINPFDQPQVELYKKEVKRILNEKNYRK